MYINSVTKFDVFSYIYNSLTNLICSMTPNRVCYHAYFRLCYVKKG